MTQKWFHINILVTVFWLITSNIENNKLHKTSVRSEQPRLAATFTSLSAQRGPIPEDLELRDGDTYLSRKSQRRSKKCCHFHQGSLAESYDSLCHLRACPVGIAWFQCTINRVKMGGKVCCYSIPELHHVKYNTMHSSSSIYFSFIRRWTASFTTPFWRQMCSLEWQGGFTVCYFRGGLPCLFWKVPWINELSLQASVNQSCQLSGCQKQQTVLGLHKTAFTEARDSNSIRQTQTQ